MPESPFNKYTAKRRAEKGISSSPDKVQELMDNLKREKEEDQTVPELPAADRALLEEEIKILQEKLKKSEEDTLRILAESENFKKRIEREKQEYLQYANEKLIQEFLVVYDHLEMTLDHAQADPLFKGVELVLRQFRTILEKFGVSIIEGNGKPFDPHLQESIGVVETSEQPSGTVIDVHRKGFLLHNRLIRPALVTVAKN